MGKKPETPAIDVATRKVVVSKMPVVPTPQPRATQAQAIPAPPKSAQSMPVASKPAQIKQPQIETPPSEEAVRVGAYLRWDAAGRPGGDGLRFWLEAEQELHSGNVSAAGKSMQKR